MSSAGPSAGEDTAKDTANMDNVVLLHLNQTKRIDMKVSIDITGIANCVVRDGNGNLLPFVWTRQSVCNEFENATLLTREALQKHLQNFIDAGVKENLEILQKVNDPALLVDWVVRTAEYWEKRYAEKRNEKYDISQTVLSAMFEVVFDTIWPSLNEQCSFHSVTDALEKNMNTLNTDTAVNEFHTYILRRVSASVSQEEHSLESFFWMHRGHNALVRLLFRTTCVPDLREHLCLLAGKLLQKKEVCNKAGTYASHRQRSDVIQEWFYAKRDFNMWCESNAVKVRDGLLSALKQKTWIFLVIDHTAVPLSLSVIKSPDMRMETQMLCPNCQAPFHSQKRRREVDMPGSYAGSYAGNYAGNYEGNYEGIVEDTV
jgi:hypothetical protein